MERAIVAWPFALALLIGMIMCLEGGRRWGIRKRAADGEGAAAGLTAIEGAIFGLFGLLLALTFSGAPARLDNRRQLIAEEANAIGTAYLRLDLLSADTQPLLRDSFRRYLDARLEFYRKLPDLDAAKTDLYTSEKLQKEIWRQAVAASRVNGAHPDAGKLLLPALNHMIDITGTRNMASRIHPPLIIFAFLFAMALVCSVLAGFGMAGSKKRSWLHIAIFAIATAGSLYVILDLEYPRAGLIRISGYDDVLLELRVQMK